MTLAVKIPLIVLGILLVCGVMVVIAKGEAPTWKKLTWSEKQKLEEKNDK